MQLDGCMVVARLLRARAEDSAYITPFQASVENGGPPTSPFPSLLPALCDTLLLSLGEVVKSQRG